MYTVILMTALSSGPDVVEFGGLFRIRSQGCTGCSGCSGSCIGACYGSCTGSSFACHGSCSGACGGFGSRIRAFISRRESCYGSCTGKSFACYGSCTGSFACCGGGMAVPTFPGPSGLATPVPAVSYSGINCESCPSIGAPLLSPTWENPPMLGGQVPTPVYPSPSMLPTPFPPLPTTPPATGVPPATPSPASPPPSVGENPGTSFNRGTASTVSSIPARATVVVRLPADATLYADGRPLTLTSAERRFVTPVLPPGMNYHYIFRVEYIRDGETITQSRRVPVRAGGQFSVEFSDLALVSRGNPAAAPDSQPVTARTTGNNDDSLTVQPTGGNTTSNKNPFLVGGQVANTAVLAETVKSTTIEPKRERARITVKLPPGAILYVDGQRNDRVELLREFSTPPLPVEQDFSYLMKIETRQNGIPESRMQKVTFRAGEIVTVDFTGFGG